MRVSRYDSMASAVAESIKTGRSLLPLPRTTNSWRSRLTELLSRLTSSETRKPPEKSSKMIARSLKPISLSLGIESSNLSSSS